LPTAYAPPCGGQIYPKPHYRADDGIRTRDPHLGKVMLYQLSHVRVPVRGYLGPVRRISPALRQNFIRSSRNHQLEAGVRGKNLPHKYQRATLLPALPQVRRRVTGTNHSFGMINTTEAPAPTEAYRARGGSDRTATTPRA
jgi:hypothetical protein